MGLTLAALVALALFVAATQSASDDFLSNDYMAFAGAARQLLDGRSPYDWADLLGLQKANGSVFDVALVMWNPPWLLPLLVPFGLTPWVAGEALFAASQWAAAGWAAALLWRTYGGETRHAWAAALFGMAFAPTLFTVLFCQVGGWQVMGLAGFLAARRANRPVLGGLALALTAAKPHLLLPFAALLAADTIRDRRTRLAVLWGVGFLAAASLMPMALRPGVWADYVGELRRPAGAGHPDLASWQPPIVAHRLRVALGMPFWFQFVPSLLACLGAVAVWWRLGRSGWGWERHLPAVVAASLLTAGYGARGNDVVLMLPAVAQAAAWAGPSRRLWVVNAVLAWNALTLTGTLPAIWWTPSLLAIYIAFSRRGGGR